MRAFHPLIPVIASGLRGAWQELVDLQPLELPPGLAEIRGELEGDAMAIDNELKCCPGLRKMHLETAQVGARLDILHCVLFPDPRYNLPLFGADVVAGPAGVSAAIVDLSPTGECLSPTLVEALEQLPQHPYKERREVPAWGSIFSKQVLFARLINAEEEGWFEADLLAFHRIFLQAVAAASPEACCAVMPCNSAGNNNSITAPNNGGTTRPDAFLKWPSIHSGPTTTSRICSSTIHHSPAIRDLGASCQRSSWLGGSGGGAWNRCCSFDLELALASTTGAHGCSAQR